ncbi:MAG: metal-dependent hydrolase [Gammaproteobacteria bacterium]|nr:metal-dependent hydrolase [Gammaproteobacteria bacterium]MCF6258990.1 metal-dependent hydrolase [Gammaproteobacteria bacterium]
MPFTPFHMGPGILVKALLQGSFSLMVFGWAQIIMDIQPLFVLITGDGHLHGFSHTYVGATLLAVFSALSGKYLSEIGLKIIGISDRSTSGSTPVKITWGIAFISAFIGTYSHVILDSIMHSDVEPFYPFSQENEILGLITIPQLHMLCIYSALAGGIIYYSVQYVRKKYNQKG